MKSILVALLVVCVSACATWSDKTPPLPPPTSAVAASPAPSPTPSSEQNSEQNTALSVLLSAGTEVHIVGSDDPPSAVPVPKSELMKKISCDTTIHFKKGSAIISHDQELVLDEAAANLLENCVQPGVRILVKGSSSSDGNPEHNRALATARAKQVALYLTSKGVPASALDPQAVVYSTPIIVYSASWCPTCKAVAQYLDNRGFTYIEKDVERDSVGRKEWETLRVRHKIGGLVPVIVVGDTVLLGYDEDALHAAIAGAEEDNRVVQLVPYIEE